MSNQEIVEIFFSRCFEEVINEKILDDKFYIIPIDRIKEYVKRFLDVPYSDFLYALIDRSFPSIKSTDITQCSSFSACEIEMCENLIKENNPGFEFIDIGLLFPNYCKSNTTGALRKYGENQVKTSRQLGLTYEYYGLWYLEAIGYVYPSLTPVQRNSFIARTLLRDPFYGSIVKDLLDHDVNIYDFLKDLKDSTITRRSAGLKRILNIALNEAMSNNIKLYNCIFTKDKDINNITLIGSYNVEYDSKSKNISNFGATSLTAAEPQQRYALSHSEILIKNYSDKSIAVYGDTKKFKDYLKEIGGKYNPYLKDGAGWIFPKKKRSQIENYFNTLISNHYENEYSPADVNADVNLINHKKSESEWLALLSSMHCASKDGQKAPHKAIFMLSLISGIQKGVLIDNKIYPTTVLIKEFKTYWNKYVPSDSPFKANFYSPYIHLQNENFYKIVTSEYTKKVDSSVEWTKSSVSKNIKYGILDEDLFLLLKTESFRNKVVDIIINKYLGTNTNIGTQSASNIALTDIASHSTKKDDVLQAIDGKTWTHKESANVNLFENQQKTSVEAKKDSYMISKNLNNRIFYIQTIGCNATGKLEDDGRIIILKGSILRDTATNTYSQREFRENIISTYCSRNEDGFICNLDLPPMSPSRSSGLVQGRSSNGKLDWKDNNGKRLADYL